MTNVKIYEHKSELAEAVAKRTIDILKQTIAEYGRAVWVLSGGSTPLMAYKLLSANYADALDWGKVTLVMGDERIGPTDGPDNNWHAISQILHNLATHNLVPQSDKSPEESALDYEQQLSKLPRGDNGLPQLDLVWLGVGPDGHTMSLFPNHPSMLPTGGLVTAVTDSPKPPSERISLSLRAITGARHAIILAAGKDKKDAIAHATQGDSSPISLVASIIKTHDGSVDWYIDSDAA